MLQEREFIAIYNSLKKKKVAKNEDLSFEFNQQNNKNIKILISVLVTHKIDKLSAI